MKKLRQKPLFLHASRNSSPASGCKRIIELYFGIESTNVTLAKLRKRGSRLKTKLLPYYKHQM